MELLLHVQGSAPEPYTITIGLLPFRIHCSCPAGENNNPCKHVRAIIHGENPGIVGNHDKQLPLIHKAAMQEGFLANYDAHDEAKDAVKKKQVKAQKCFLEYYKSRCALALGKVKTDKTIIKAQEAMEAAILDAIAAEVNMTKSWEMVQS